MVEGGYFAAENKLRTLVLGWGGVGWANEILSSFSTNCKWGFSHGKTIVGRQAFTEKGTILVSPSAVRLV